MDPAIVSRKRRQLTQRMAALGVVLVIAFAIYFGFHPDVDRRGDVWIVFASFGLCPGSLLFAVFIDAEPWTSGYAFVWLVAGLISIGLYGAIGRLVGKLLWKPD